MIDKIFEWIIAIIFGALGICAVFACIGLLIVMIQDFFN